MSLERVSVSAARGLDPDDIGHSFQAEIAVPVDVQHDPEPASRGSVAGGGDDQTELFGKRISKAASRPTKESGRGIGHESILR